MMKKTALTLAMMLCSSIANAAGPESEYIELCVADSCSLPVQTKEFDGALYLVRTYAEYQKLSGEWSGAKFAIVSEQDYQEIKGSRETFSLPTMNRAGKPGSGPLVSGSVNVNVNVGGDGCGQCHKGNWKEIHAKMLAPKVDLK